MSLAYCFKCLERTDACECPECDGDCNPDVIYGEKRVSYEQGRRDALDGSIEEAESTSEFYMKAYKAGFRDGQLGHKPIPHKTMKGWCCACDYDQVVYEDKLRAVLKPKRQEVV